MLNDKDKTMIIDNTKITGEVSAENLEEVTSILNWYNWEAGYISNSGQRRDAERSNNKKIDRLKELGVIDFELIKR